MIVKSVYLFTSGMVIVFNEKGEQIPELQGRLDTVKEKILEASDQNTRFNISRWNEWAQPLRRDEFEALSYKPKE